MRGKHFLNSDSHCRQLDSGLSEVQKPVFKEYDDKSDKSIVNAMKR